MNAKPLISRQLARHIPESRQPLSRRVETPVRPPLDVETESCSDVSEGLGTFMETHSCRERRVDLVSACDFIELRDEDDSLPAGVSKPPALFLSISSRHKLLGFLYT